MFIKYVFIMDSTYITKITNFNTNSNYMENENNQSDTLSKKLGDKNHNNAEYANKLAFAFKNFALIKSVLVNKLALVLIESKVNLIRKKY